MTRLLVAEISIEKGIHLSELNRLAKLSPDVSNRYWHNKTRIVNFTVLERIARALGVKVIDLIKED